MVSDLLMEQGHRVVFREIIRDDPSQISQQVRSLAASQEIDAVLLTGGTGISPRDQTFEAVAALLERTLPGFGELFRWLSYQEIGPAAMLSRTIGGLLNRTVILTMPGSPSAVRLAMQRLILPELGHMVQQAGKER
jgi:molybdenum cofactor biosynthesis protein B